MCSPAMKCFQVPGAAPRLRRPLQSPLGSCHAVLLEALPQGQCDLCG